MNLDELQSVQSRERQIDSLQQLHDTFYRDAGRFIQQLRNERETVAQEATDPFDSPDVQRLTDEINTAERTVESIYERRIGKLVKQASLEAAGMAADVDGLTSEEQETFDRLVGTIEDSRSRVLDTVLSRDQDDDATDGSSAPTTDSPAATDANAPAESTSTPESSLEMDAASAMGTAGNEPADDPTPPPPPDEPLAEESTPVHSDATSKTESDASDDIERKTVRITADVGEILGVDDRAYDLCTDDVVTLPALNADPLLEQDAAVQLDPS